MAYHLQQMQSPCEIVCFQFCGGANSGKMLLTPEKTRGLQKNPQFNSVGDTKIQKTVAPQCIQGFLRNLSSWMVYYLVQMRWALGHKTRLSVSRGQSPKTDSGDKPLDCSIRQVSYTDSHAHWSWAVMIFVFYFDTDSRSDWRNNEN